MKIITSLQDLRPYGITMLTGEACAYSHRILCDLDLEGYKLMCSTYGLPYMPPTSEPNCKECGLGERQCMCEGDRRWQGCYQWEGQLCPPGWPAGYNDGVASCKLTYDAWTAIAVHALLEVDLCHTVLALHNKLNRADKPGAPTGHQSGVMGLTGAEAYTSAPFDWQKGRYTGEPALLSMPEWKAPLPWFDIQGCAPGRTYKALSGPRRGANMVHQMTGRTL